MSETEGGRRARIRRWARPGGSHDWIMRFLKIVLPVGVGVLLAYLLVSPLSEKKEISFLLDKNKVETAKERLKVQGAEYRGVDDEGRSFSIRADQAIQATSNDPVVQMSGMSARMEMKDGPATIRADQGRYHMERQEVNVLGPILVTASDGYRLETRNVLIDMNRQTLVGRGGVEGQMRLGRFTAGEVAVDLKSRRVVLTGRPRLHIVQGALR